MTTLRFLILVLAAIAFPTFLYSAPPADLAGKFVTLDGNRLEFVDPSMGTDAGADFSYSYSILDAASASVVMTYASGLRSRDITLYFDDLGSPAGYDEFDRDTSGPPIPPIFRQGSFEIGELDVSPPPPPAVESSAPASLTGSFIKAGPGRYEFLTDTEGRLFVPGEAEYFTYLYEMVDEFSSKVTMLFEDGDTSTELILLFDSEGLPVSFTSTTFEEDSLVDEGEGEFEMGINLHLGDLVIGNDAGEPVGDDYFNAVGSKQTVGNHLRAVQTVAYPFAVQNDGDTDAFRLRGTRGRRTFSVGYFTMGSRENVTASIVAGRYETESLEHGEEAGFVMEVTPLRKNGAMVAGISARSLTVEDAKDFVKSFTKVKVKKKKARGKSKARGKKGQKNKKGGKKKQSKRKGKKR